MTKNTLFRSCALIALATASCPALAQSSPQADKAPPSTAPAPDSDQETQPTDIVVTGFRASLARSLEIKRNATGISDAITAEDIGKFPDLNISESLQRIPGVTLNRNAFGEGRQINLRGLGPQFTLVEINGVPGTSNNDGSRDLGNSEGSGGRGFSFEILPSELFTGAVVNKTSLPSLTEGGLAGSVQLVTPRPLSQKDGLHFSASALGNYSEINGKVDPRGAAMVSYKPSDSFGIVAQIAYSDTTYLSNTIEGGSWRAFSNSNTGPIKAPANVGAALAANGPRYLYVRDHRKTLGATLSTQWRPTDTLELSVDGLYGRLKSNREQLRDDMAIEGGVNAPTNFTIDNGVITSGDFTNVQQRVGANYYTSDDRFFQVSGSVKWTPDEYWTITPMVGYSSRKEDGTFNLYSFRLASSAGVFDPGTVHYSTRGNFLDFNSTATNFDSNPQNFLFNTFAFRPTIDEDNEFSTKLDVERKFDSALKNVRFGIRYSDRDKTRQAFDVRLNRIAGTPTTGVPNLSAAYNFVDFGVPGGASFVPSQLLNVDEDKVRSLFLPNGLSGAPIAGTALARQVANEAGGTYGVSEKTLAGYAQAEFDVGNFNLVTGVRFIRTQQTASGSQVANANLPSQQITPVTIEKTYQFFLPSMTARWEVMKDVILRAAYGRTLTRPNLGDVAPRESFNGIDASGGKGTTGNPNLTPYTADNFDVGAEWYFSKDGLIGVNAFYKDIKDFIDTTSFVENRTFPRQSDAVLVTGPITFVRPVNGVSAKIKGVEVTVQSRLNFISPALRSFGFLANYSHTDSSANFATVGDVRSQGLPGLSKNSYNLVGYYDDGRFDARFTYAWRSRYLAEFAAEFGVPRFAEARGQLDFSANYDLTKNFSVQFQVQNLTKSQQANTSSALYLPYNVAELDRRFFFGGRVKF
ncbi:TonB-dependent receptor [Sphingomonas koreensis]|nr:TonB-dependent receptor [Sphingomonas koreensis]